MKSKINVLAICGSTRKQSYNLNLIKAIAAESAGNIEINLFEGLAGLPQFNPDLNHLDIPQSVTDFREQIKSADGVLICTPEYAMGVPGALKNAIDWTVATREFSKKPVALITASTSGEKAHESLSGTLKVIEAGLTEDTSLLIPFIGTKVNAHAQITDEETRDKILVLLDKFMQQIVKVPEKLLM